MTKMNDIAPLIKEMIGQNKCFTFPVKGTSMQPLLHSNDVVTLAPIENVKKKDIFLYQRKDGTYVLHRLWKIKKNAYVFIGDHQLTYEYPVYKEMLIAKVISYKKTNRDKIYYLKGFKYRIYLFLINFKIFRRLVLLLRK